MFAENLLGKCMKCSTENPTGTNESLESVTHHGGGIVRECEEDDLSGGGRNGGIRKKMGNSGCQCSSLAGSGRGQNTHVLCRRLSDDGCLFLI